MTTMIVPVHVFYPLLCALKNISILLVTVMIVMVLKLVMMVLMMLMVILLMMMVMVIVMMLLLMPLFMIAAKLFLQPLVVKILIVQSFLFPLLLFAGRTITFFILLPEVFLPRIDILDLCIIAGNELFPLRMERFRRHATSCVIIITISIGSLTATTITMIAAIAIASVETSGTGRTVRITTSTDLARFDPATECLLLLWKRGGNKILRHKHKL